MSQVKILDKMLEDGQKSLDFFLQRDFSTESPGFYDHLRTVARMAQHAFDIMEPVTRKWAELHDDEVQGKLSITAEDEDEMLDPDNIKKKISPQDDNGEQVSISSISEPSQDVSFSTKSGRELPITAQVNTEVTTDVSDVQSNSVVSNTCEDEVLSETESLVSDFGCLLSSIAESSPATSVESVSTAGGAPDFSSSLETSSSKLSQDGFVKNILQAFKKVAPNSRYKPRRHRGKKSRVIPAELSMLWSHSAEIFQERKVSQPNKVEITPRVNWDRVNQGAMRRFPKPFFQPIHSVSPLASFYERSCSCPRLIQGHPLAHQDMDIYGRVPNNCGCPTQFEMPEPFGFLPGYVTNLGVVPVPDTPIHGHIWDQDSQDWILHAEYPTSGSESTLSSNSSPNLQLDRQPASSRGQGPRERQRGRRRPPERR